MLRRHSALRNQLGYSMIELLFVIMITSAIAIPLTTFAINGLKSYTFLEAQSNTSVELNTLAGRIAKVVRGASSVETADPNTLIIKGYFSPQDSIIKSIRYTVSGSTLTIGVTPPGGSETTTALRIDLVMGTKPIFTYYGEAGNDLGTSPDETIVKSIGIYLAANPTPKQIAVPISLSTRVSLRNLKRNL